MPKLSLTKRQIEFIKANRLLMSGSDMALKFKVGKGVVNRYMNKNGLTPPKEILLQFRSKRMYRPFTKREDNYIRKNIECKSLKQIGAHLKRTSAYVGKRTRELGYGNLIDAKALESRFKPGTIPPNKGKKMPIDIYKKCQATMFKRVLYHQIQSSTVLYN